MLENDSCFLTMTLMHVEIVSTKPSRLRNKREAELWSLRKVYSECPATKERSKRLLILERRKDTISD